MKNQQCSHGFTLLEMSIVLVIIGLVVGSIVAGQSMIRSSQLQTMLGEFDANLKAVKEFQDKFLALPGDMNNAESMWGSNATCPATASGVTPHVATCNGDGNGTIGSSDTAATLTNSREWFRAWQQLSNAGFITAQLTGTPGSGGVQEARVGQNVPSSSVRAAGWTLLYYSQIADNTFLWGDQYGHVLAYGGFLANNMTLSPVLTSAEALAIDQKIDDGNPGMGIVRAYRTAFLPNCTINDTTQLAQTYAKTGSTAFNCSLMFLMRF